MFASGTGSMRGPRGETPLLLLLLLLLTTLTGTVLCQYEDEVPESGTPEDEVAITEADDGISETTVENPIEEDHGSGLSRSLPIDVSLTESTVDPSITDPTLEPGVDDGELNPIIIIVIPVVLVVVIIAMIVCGIVISRRWKKKELNQELRKEDPYLDGSGTEKVPMPMFEEDVPSVLELEMEELDQWMKKDDEPAEDSKHA